MPLSVEAQKKVLKALKYSDEEIAKAIGEGENDVEVKAEIKVFTGEEYTALEANLKDTGKNTHIKAGKEIAIKELKEKAGLEYEGKDPEAFLEKYRDAVVAEAKIEPKEAQKRWEQEKQTLQSQIKTIEEAKAAIEAKVKAAEFDAGLLAKFPQDRNKSLSDADRLLLLKNKIEVKDEDGKQVVYYNGSALKDNLTNPLPLDAAIAHVFNAEKWVGGDNPPPPGGFGGNDSTRVPGVFNTLKEVNAEIAKQGLAGERQMKFVQEAIAKNPALDMNIV